MCLLACCLYFQFSPSEVYAVLYSFRKLSDSWRRYRIGCVHSTHRSSLSFMLRFFFHTILFILVRFMFTILSILKCVCIYFQNYFLFFRLFGALLFSKQIFKLFSSHLFEQNASIEINVKCVLCICVRRCVPGNVQNDTAEGNRQKGTNFLVFSLKFWLEIEIFGFVWWRCYRCFCSCCCCWFSVLSPLLSFATRASLFFCIEDIDDGKFTECECTVHNSKCLVKW